MCGRYTLHHTPGQISLRFGVEEVLAEPQERYNIAPSQAIPVIIVNKAENKAENKEVRALEAYKWGLVPFWAKDPAIGNKLINARAETLAEKPSFKNALTRRRCLIPSDGFYEWKKEDGARQPMYIRRRDGDLFAFAGLWEEWKGPDGVPLRTCSIITVAPNALMADIHDRMPAMLHPDLEKEWLNPANNQIPDLLSLLQPYSPADMEAYAVTKRVNAPVNEGPACIESLAASA